MAPTLASCSARTVRCHVMSIISLRRLTRSRFFFLSNGSQGSIASALTSSSVMTLAMWMIRTMPISWLGVILSTATKFSKCSPCGPRPDHCRPTCATGSRLRSPHLSPTTWKANVRHSSQCFFAVQGRCRFDGHHDTNRQLLSRFGGCLCKQWHFVHPLASECVTSFSTELKLSVRFF